MPTRPFDFGSIMIAIYAIYVGYKLFLEIVIEGGLSLNQAILVFICLVLANITWWLRAILGELRG